jgi:hypothetical protein
MAEQIILLANVTIKINKMNQLETALQTHDRSLNGYQTRTKLDQLMRENPEQATALWQQYCPWSDANGGYIAWAKNK